MTEEDTVLIDTPLIPDPDADEEMGALSEAIADEDLQGSRLLLVRRAIEAIELEGTQGGIVQLVCTFQPGDGARFTSAQFRLRLSAPEGIRAIDLAPRSIDDPNPVEFTLNHKGQLGVTSLPVPLDPKIEMEVNRKFAKYHCRVQGSGEGTNMLRWDFRENPDRKDGIGQEQVLTITLPVTGQITGEALVSARLARPGLGGKIDAIRDLIFGVSQNKRVYPIDFEIPSIPSPMGIGKFMRLF